MMTENERNLLLRTSGVLLMLCESAKNPSVDLRKILLGCDSETLWKIRRPVVQDAIDRTYAMGKAEDALMEVAEQDVEDARRELNKVLPKEAAPTPEPSRVCWHEFNTSKPDAALNFRYGDFVRRYSDGACVVKVGTEQKVIPAGMWREVAPSKWGDVLPSSHMNDRMHPADIVCRGGASTPVNWLVMDGGRRIHRFYCGQQASDFSASVRNAAFNAL